MLIGFDGANIQQFPDNPALSAVFLTRHGGEGKKRRDGGAVL
jgi:hypothetical protein